MSNMETTTALEVKKAIITLADYLDMPEQEVVSNICFLDKKRMELMVKASEKWNKFEGTKDIKKRAKMLGIQII